MLPGMKPWDLWRWLAVAAAAGTLVLGLVFDLPRPVPERREPVWAVHLAALRDAPVPPGTPVSLILPGELAKSDAEKLIMETVWQRPDLRWLPSAAFPEGGDLQVAMLLAPRAELHTAPPGWREVWNRGWVRLFRRVRP